MTARAASHAIALRRPRRARARRRRPAAAASRPSWADSRNETGARHRARAARRARTRARSRARACLAANDAAVDSLCEPQDGWLRISRASLTAIAPTTSTPAMSTVQSAAVRHGNGRGATSAAAPPSSRRAPSVASGTTSAGGSSADHTDANVASGPASSANVPAASRYGAPPRAATRRYSCGNDERELRRLAAQRRRRHDAPVARLAAAKPQRHAREIAALERQLVEELAVCGMHPRSVERAARRDVGADPAVIAGRMRARPTRRATRRPHRNRAHRESRPRARHPQRAPARLRSAASPVPPWC